MKQTILFLFVLSAVWHPATLRSQTLSGSRPVAANPSEIKDSYDFRRFLTGSTWTWCWAADGSNGSEFTFTADGKVKHSNFVGQYIIRSRSDVEIQCNGSVAKMHFDPATYRTYTGEDFGNIRPLFGALRPPGNSDSIKDVTTAAFAAASDTPTAAQTPASAFATAHASYFGTTAPGVSTLTPKVDPAVVQDPNVRAGYVVTVADDFVVEAYQNGRVIPHEKRKVLSERYGAMTERIGIEVRSGDWLVFNVVNNQMRWHGTYYFAVAGCLAPDRFGFVSNWQSGDWSSCDSLGDIGRFVNEKTYLSHSAVHKVTNPWADGDGLMREFSSGQWSGTPLWGTTRNTWVKIIVP